MGLLHLMISKESNIWMIFSCKASFFLSLIIIAKQVSAAYAYVFYVSLCVSGFTEEVQFWRMFQGMMEMYNVRSIAITVLGLLPLCTVAGMFTCSIVMTCL